MFKDALAGKITGMLLQGLDTAELVSLVCDARSFKAKVEEAGSAKLHHSTVRCKLLVQQRLRLFVKMLCLTLYPNLFNSDPKEAL